MKHLALSILIILGLLLVTNRAHSEVPIPQKKPVPRVGSINFGMPCDPVTETRQALAQYNYSRTVVGIMELALGPDNTTLAAIEVWVHPTRNFLITMSFGADGNDYTCQMAEGDSLKTDDLQALFGKAIDH